MSKDMAKKILSIQKGQSFSKIGSGDMVPMVYLSNDERDQLKKEFGRLSRDVPGPSKGISIPNLINLANTGKPSGDYDTEGQGKHLIFKMKRKGSPKTIGDAAKMAGLRLEGNELGEAMSGEDVAKRMMKIKTMKSFANKVAKMKTVSRDDLEKMLPDYVSGGDITKVMEAYELSEQKISKELAIKILSMNKGNKFVKASGDLVPEIYLSGFDRDALKKEFGKLPRGLPSGSRGVTVVDMINYALGKDGVIDTEDGETNAPKLISWQKGGKVIGRPKDVGDAAKIAGVRLEAYEYGTPEATKHSLKVTPGQSSDDWDKQVGVMQEKQISMREALAKMWGVDEGHNPFKNEEEEKNPKKEGKTMTGKPTTKVSINPDIKEKIKVKNIVK